MDKQYMVFGPAMEARHCLLGCHRRKVMQPLVGVARTFRLDARQLREGKSRDGGCQNG